MNSELNAVIFYGYKEKFENQISQIGDYKTLTEIVVDFDTSRNAGSTYYDLTENLVVFSDEYGSVNESVLQNFMTFVKLYNVKNIFVQNPPVKLVENLKRFIQKDNIKEINYNFDVLTIEKLKDFSIRIGQEILGQERAIKSLKTSLLTHIKFCKNNKPLVLMFYGSSGVGKTETSKILSNIINNDSELFIKPFGMYQNSNIINNLYGEKISEGSFAKELLDRKSNVILIDEFDKANPICYSAFYQLFDEGIFVDKNYNVNLKNSIIICTSNYKDIKEIREELGEPIFYRFDAFIKFDDLSDEHKKIIVERKYDKYIAELDEEDKKIIESSNIKSKLLCNTSLLQNVRDIDSKIKEVLALLLLNEIEKQ